MIETKYIVYPRFYEPVPLFLLLLLFIVHDHTQGRNHSLAWGGNAPPPPPPNFEKKSIVYI